MATGTIILPVQGVKLPSTNPARIDGGNKRFYLLFDDTTAQSAQWQLQIPSNYGSGLQIKLLFTMESTQSGTNTVEFDISVMAVTPDDSADIETDSFDTLNSGSEVLASDQTAGYLKELSLSLSNVDSLASGDLIILKIERDVTNDTATSDVRLAVAILEYTIA